MAAILCRNRGNVKRTEMTWLPFPQHQIDKIRGAGQCGDAADGKFRRGGDGAGERVGNQQEEGPEEEGIGEQTAVVAAHEQTRHVRHDEPDETDGTAESHHHGNQHGGCD